MLVAYCPRNARIERDSDLEICPDIPGIFNHPPETSDFSSDLFLFPEKNVLWLSPPFSSHPKPSDALPRGRSFDGEVLIKGRVIRALRSF